MPALMVGGASFLVPYIAILTGNGAPSLVHATAAMGTVAALLACGIFGAIYFALRLVFKRLPERDTTRISIPPAE
jgi:hypothetical protein